MADTVSPEQRSRNMSRIRSKNTKPELLIRRLLHRAGYRFRLHGATRGGSLPGKPDLVFAGRRKVIFVNGCFWHTHSCPAGTHAPATNPEFWAAKRARTLARDAAALQALNDAGWEALVVWECEMRNASVLESQLLVFLGPPGAAESSPLDSPATITQPKGN
ncbi:very short patch repair endonuclease [Arthrobacter sp. zg-Y916]|uniref:very short patch repair endonuclease n=1 Tax=Arthrobacter sp. zg-Y916 TaxID=2894190 RepID=UPI001E4918DC|nr:very short patch repair endonuclease [Arthrobacter sp. zg-Y916]MCC9194505.1 very short patch repair endonuclease [Arthrobacter sp. zg-Y916]